MSYAYDFSTNTSTGTVSYDIRIQPQIWTPDSNGTVRSISNYPDFSNVQTPSTQISSYNNAKYGIQNTGTVNNCISVYATSDFTSSVAGSTISNMYGLYYDGGGTGTCVLNNHYGLYVNQPGYGTNCFAGYFGGQVGIGGTSASGALTITSIPNSPYGIFIPQTTTFTGVDGTGTQINQAVIKMNQTQQMLNTTAYRGSSIAVTPLLSKVETTTLRGIYSGLYVNYQFSGLGVGSIAGLYGIYIDAHSNNQGIFNVNKYVGVYVAPSIITGGLNTNTSFGAELHNPSAIGTTPSSKYMLNIGTDSLSTISSFMRLQGTLSVGSPAEPVAGVSLNGANFTSCTGSIGTQSAIYVSSNLGVGNLASSISNASGLDITITTNTSQSTVTNCYGAYIRAVSCSTGTTNAYGLYISTPTSAVNNYCAYFNSGIGIGVTPPFTGIQCAGNIVPATDNVYTCGNNGLRWTNIWATSGVVNSSDRTMKTDIQDEKLGLDFVTQLRPVTYRWKNHEVSYSMPRQVTSTGHHSIEDHHKWKEHLTVKKYVTHKRYHHGLIAQEVKDTMDRNNVRPEDAGFWIDSSVNDPTSPASQGLIYTEFIPILIKSIQELKSELQDLRLQVSLMYRH